MTAKQHHHHAKTGKPMHRGQGVNLMLCKPPLGATEQVWIIHKMRTTLAPSMKGRRRGATSVLFASKRAGHLTDKLMSTAPQRTCCNL
jgi:hypothetical protein